MRIRTHNLGNLLSLIKEQNRRHSTDPKFLRDVGHLVYVDLVELGLWVFGAEFFDFGSDRFAGAAPFGPGIQDDGAVGGEDLREEVLFAGLVLVVSCEGLGKEGREGRRREGEVCTW